MSLKKILKESAEAAKGLAEEIADEAKDLAEKAEDLAEKAGDAFKTALSDEPSHLERARFMYKLIGEGKMTEAFDKFYHEDVVMQEATGEVRKGKAASRTFMEQFQSTIQEVHGTGVHAVTSNEKAKVTMVESWMEVTFKDGNRVKMEEVAVQRWDDGKIIHERFYYNAPPA